MRVLFSGRPRKEETVLPGKTVATYVRRGQQAVLSYKVDTDTGDVHGHVPTGSSPLSLFASEWRYTRCTPYLIYTFLTSWRYTFKSRIFCASLFFQRSRENTQETPVSHLTAAKKRRVLSKQLTSSGHIDLSALKKETTLGYDDPARVCGSGEGWGVL